MASFSLIAQPLAGRHPSPRARSSVRLSGAPRSLLSVQYEAPHNAAIVSNNIRYRKWQGQLLVSRAPSFGRKSKNARNYRVECSSVPAEGTQEEEKAESEYLGDLRVPQAWVDPQVAAREAEWLKVALHQWLDDEYCPEIANEEISKRCSKVYYYCLLEEQLDVGDILMQMVRGLETFSFKESFHGAFSSANAAIDLITKRMRRISLEEKDSTLDDQGSRFDSTVQ